MRKVVEHGDAPDRPAHFQPALDASKAREGLECNAGLDADMKRGGDGGKRVHAVMCSGQHDLHWSDRFSVVP